MASARSPLPVPRSPRMRIGASRRPGLTAERSRRAAWARTSAIGALSPRSRPRLSMGCIVAAALLSCSLGSDRRREWSMPDSDVVGGGAGNAAGAAAVSAREQGARRVVVLEKAPRELRGGNTHDSGGLLRFAYDRAEDLLPLVVGSLFH